MTMSSSPRSRRTTNRRFDASSTLRHSGLLAILIGLFLMVLAPTSGSAQSASLRTLADDARISLGAAVDAAGLGDAAYRDLLAEQVNLLSTRGDLSMAKVQPERGSFDFADVEAIVDFGVENGVAVRGHELISGAVPAWVSNGSWTAETLSDVLREHVTAVIGHFRERNPGVVTQWDVVGDAFLPDGSPRPTIWQQVIGDDYLRIAFEAARAADPDATLFYDDFYDDLAVTQDAVASGTAIVAGANAERTTCDAVAKCVAVRDRIGALAADGVPIDGIGFQSHLFSPDPADFAQLSGWVDELGLQWAVTEFDVPLPVTEIDNPVSLDFQADVYASALTACVDAPGCDTFVTWGISDRFSPIPAETGGAFGGALWFDANDVAKPAFDAMVEVLLRQAPPTPTTPTLSSPDNSVAPATVSPVTTVEAGSSDSGAVVAVLAGIAALGALAAVIVISRRRRRGSAEGEGSTSTPAEAGRGPDAKNP